MKNSPLVLPALLTPHQAFVYFERRVDDVVPVVCKVNLAVTITTVDAAFRTIEPRLQEIPTLLPKLDLSYVLEMPSLVRAVAYAAGRVTTSTSSGEIARQLAAARRLRAPMLCIAEGLAMMTPSPMLPPERVAKIRAGSGPYDTARDLTDLAGLYREFAPTIVDKHPFDAGRLDVAEALGIWLQRHLAPNGAVTVAPSRKAALLRDRLWAALLLRDAKLRVVTRALFENEADKKVPPLRTRVVKHSPAAPVAAPEPEPQPQPEAPAKTIA